MTYCDFKYINPCIIAEVHEATPWINSFVIFETVKHEKRKVRKCLDPKPLNKAIMHEPYITHTHDDVYHNLANAKYITVIEFNKSFWQIPMDEESIYLKTLKTYLEIVTNVVLIPYMVNLTMYFYTIRNPTCIFQNGRRNAKYE